MFFSAILLSTALGLASPTPRATTSSTKHTPMTTSAKLKPPATGRCSPLASSRLSFRGPDDTPDATLYWVPTLSSGPGASSNPAHSF
ncbi:hypothetical protein B0H16DRAFT_1496707 [Mycena metata]|uniref:Secreted protein n=1 Tax=Mycena metata TaxID=1033252 RepID=A0AAD7KDN0_9AGAR|nr:hypothetical protein B0H16DRAFT_1496707 [Mycena metata]